MKIAVNGDLFTLKKGIHELNLTVGGVPFKEDGLLNKVRMMLGCYFALDLFILFYFFIFAVSPWTFFAQMLVL